jgi:hypothetical protein
MRAPSTGATAGRPQRRLSENPELRIFDVPEYATSVKDGKVTVCVPGVHTIAPFELAATEAGATVVYTNVGCFRSTVVNACADGFIDVIFAPLSE